MNLLELRTEARSRLDDTIPRFLWSDAELDKYANEAEREACERAKLIEDDALASVPFAVTGITQSGGLATANIVGHPFTPGQAVNFSGANQAAYSGDFRISVKDADNVCFFVDATTVSPATGTIMAQAVLGMVTNIAGLANIGTYELDPRVIEVRAALWKGRFLTGIARETLNDPNRADHRWAFGDFGSYFSYPSWDSNRDWTTLKGEPRYFIDPQERYITLVRIPIEDAPIRVSVYRYPLLAMVNPDTDLDQNATVPSPEIAERHHFRLVDWIMRCAYLKKDSETFDKDEADKAEARFEASFGKRPDVNVRRMQRARRANQVRMNPAW